MDSSYYSLFYTIKYSFSSILFTTPYIALSFLFSFLFSLFCIFIVCQEQKIGVKRLPPYPGPALRSERYVIIGGVRRRKRPEPASHPRGLTIYEGTFRLSGHERMEAEATLF